jgi:peroxiredoxin
MQAEFAKRDVAVVAISVDSPETSKHLADALGLTFEILSNPARGEIRQFGVEDAENEIAWPSIFVVGRDFTIEWRWLADTFKERIATADVLHAIDALPVAK